MEVETPVMPQRSTRFTLAAGSAVALAALLGTAACSGASGGSGGGTAAGFNAAAASVVHPSTAKGGTLRFTAAQDFDSLDPQRGYYGFMWDFARYYTRQLITYDTKPGNASLKLVPDLATSLAQVTDGGRTYTYHLRSGATWEDGSPVTAQDVKYGIERTWAQDVITGGPIWLMQNLDNSQKYPGPYKDPAPDKLGLKSIDTPDDHTVVFHLAKPNGDFEQMLALPEGSPVKRSKDTGAKYGLRPFSDGPYKFLAYQPNKTLVLVRNDKWNKASDPIRPALPDRIEVVYGSNADDLDSKLLNGEADLDLNQTGLQQAARVKVLRDPRLKASTDDPTTGYIRYVSLVPAVKPLDNIHCRKAVIYATDHKALQTARGGPIAGGDIGTNMLPDGVKGADTKYDPYGLTSNGGAPDIARAKSELQQCGKPGGFSTTIAVRNNKSAEVASAVALQASLKAVGITTQIDQYDGAQTPNIIGVPNVVHKKGYGLIVMGWGPDFYTGQGFLQPLVDGRFILPNGNNNYSEINDPAINGEFDQAIATTDADKAGQLYSDINHRVMQDAYYLPIVYDKALVWRSDRLTNAYTATSYSGKYDFVSLGVEGAK